MPSRFSYAAVMWTAGPSALVLAWACGSSSLDDSVPSHTAGTVEDSGDTLPALDDGGESSGVGTSDEPGPETPALCEPGCRITLPSRWTFEGVPEPPEDAEPGTHWVPVLLREADGGVTIAEQRRSWVTLHRLESDGTLRWSRPLPLPCDRCELGHAARHPSGDLLLGATGTVIDGGFAVLAGRYDPEGDELRWWSSHPIGTVDEIPSRSGEIVAVSESITAQLYVEGVFEFTPVQSIGVLVFGADGELLELENLQNQNALNRRWPLLLRPTPTDELMVAVPRGNASSPYALLGIMDAPLWMPTGSLTLPQPLDDLVIDERAHTLTVGHVFDGDRIHLLLDDRNGLDSEHRWVASLAVPSTTESPVELARGPDGDLYTAVRTTQSVTEPGDPDDAGSDPDSGESDPLGLVGLSLARWSSDGELRWSTTMLADLDASPRPVVLEMEGDELLLATVAGDRLRVERRQQRCLCE